MVNIIINEITKNTEEDNEISTGEVLEIKEESNNEEVINIIQKEFQTLTKTLDKQTKEYSKILKKQDVKIKTLNSKIEVLIEENEKLNILIKGLHQRVEDMSKDTEPVVEVSKEKETSENEVKSKSRRGVKYDDTETFIPNRHVGKAWTDLKLCDNGDIINDGYKIYHLPIQLNDLLYIMECDTPHMNRGEFKRLQAKYHINVGMFAKIIYNIRDNRFDKVLQKYNERLSSAKFDLTSDNYLKINKSITNIKKEDAKHWVSLVLNSNKPQQSILKIQEDNKGVDKDYIRIVCDSCTNTKLNSLLNINEPMFIENNPSKRKTLLEQGGIF